MKSIIALIAGLLASFLCGNALATIVGTFNIAGNVTVTNTGIITWTSLTNTANQAGISGASGIYSALGGTSATIHGLNSAIEPVGVPFPAQSFISFDANPALSSLLINFIFAGIFPSTQCAMTPAAVGQQCTPPGSLFNFVNNGPPASPQGTATWVFSGASADGSDTWSGNFTSQFTTPYQTVLSGLATTGSFTNTYSATITVQTASTSVPEPSTMTLMTLGLMSMLFFLRRRDA